MILQYAIDTLPLEEGIAIAEKVREYVDIIELGERMISKYSLSAVTKMKEVFPEKKILADIKIMDAGYAEVKMMAEAGADYVVVMYAGRVVEKGTAKEIFKDPRHPYTIGLMNSKPVVGKHIDKLYSIPGSVPNPVDMPDYCYFKDRCEMCVEGCEGEYPRAYQVSPTHVVSCYRCKEGGAQDGK